MLKKVLTGVAVVVVLFLGFAATRPGRYHVERTITIAAPASQVFAQLDDFRAWSAWSPWEKMDPGMHKEFAGPARGVGASYAWRGNDQVGQGKMTVVEHKPPRTLRIKLEFIEPFAAVSDVAFNLVPNGSGSTAVTWAMDGANNFIGKVFSVFMDMDAAVGGDFERGLAQLKRVSEASSSAAPSPSSEP